MKIVCLKFGQFVLDAHCSCKHIAAVCWQACASLIRLHATCHRLLQQRPCCALQIRETQAALWQHSSVCSDSLVQICLLLFVHELCLDAQVFFIQLVVWVLICRLQRLICFQTLHACLVLCFACIFLCLICFLCDYSESILQICFFRFVYADSFVNYCFFRFIVSSDLFLQIHVFICVSSESFLRIVSSASLLQIRCFRCVSSYLFVQHWFVPIRFFRFVCSNLFPQICLFNFVSSDSLPQLCCCRFVCSDLFLQICLFNIDLFRFGSSDLFLQVIRFFR